MQEFLDKLSKGELGESEVKEFEGKLSEEGKKLLREALAFTTKRQDELGKSQQLETKVKELQASVIAEEAKISQMKSEGTQFRQEQVDKARTKFFTDYNIPVEKQTEYEEKFKALDSGKVDSELVYQDFVGVYAFLNKDTLLKADSEKRDMERKAAEEAARGAGGGGNPPAGDPPKTHSDVAMKLAKDAGITPEAATRIEKEGMTRTIG